MIGVPHVPADTSNKASAVPSLRCPTTSPLPSTPIVVDTVPPAAHVCVAGEPTIEIASRLEVVPLRRTNAQPVVPSVLTPSTVDRSLLSRSAAVTAVSRS